jgi:type II secretory pathway component GspD/PulD (secretin)
MSNANIFGNWKALEAAHGDRNMPVSLALRNVKFSKALKTILSNVSGGQMELGYMIDEGVITISTVDDLSKNVDVRVYDIRDLLAPITDVQSDNQAPATKPSAGRTPPRTRQDLVDAITRLIMDTVSTNTWKGHGGTVGALRELEGQLIITQTPDSHREIVKLLEQLREQRGLQVSVEMRLFSCEQEMLARLLTEWEKRATTRPVESTTQPDEKLTGIFLTDVQVSQFMHSIQNDSDSYIITAPRVTLFNSQRAFVRVSTQRAYVRDYSTTITKSGDTRFEPVVGNAEFGILWEVRTTVSADRGSVTLFLHPKLSVLEGMSHKDWQGRPAGSNLAVDEPQMKISEMQTLVSIPNGGTLLLGGMKDPDANNTASTKPAGAAKARGLFMMVRPRIIPPNAAVQKEFPLLKQRN